ncbi:hypothetical protein M1D34_30185 (plasmid) [Ensifer sp. D2-11]
MNVRKAGKARLLLAVPELRRSPWMMRDPIFLNLCEAYELACLDRDALRRSAIQDETTLMKSEEECRMIEATVVDYVRKHQGAPHLV